MTPPVCTANRHIHKLGTAGCHCGHIPADGSPVATCTGCSKGGLEPGCPVHDPQARRSAA